MNGNPDVELQLGPDFATRVLEAADRLVARQRRLRRVAVASVLCAAVAATAVWLELANVPQGPPQPRNPMYASTRAPGLAGEMGAQVAERDSAPDALSWFFPDAEPLARYAAEDTGDDSGDSAGALFAGDE